MALTRWVVECDPPQSSRYRYFLRIGWQAPLHPVTSASGIHLAVILKNPSTADSTRSDPTIGKLEAWARGRGFQQMSVVNLFAYRSPYPMMLNRYCYRTIVGRGNDLAICRALLEADYVVAAWGNPNGIDPVRYLQRIYQVLTLVAQLAVPLYHVGTLTKAGQPRHGLFWTRDMEMRVWKDRETRRQGDKEMGRWGDKQVL